MDETMTTTENSIEPVVFEHARYEARQHLRYALDECNRAIIVARRAKLTEEEICEIDGCCRKIRETLKASELAPSVA